MHAIAFSTGPGFRSSKYTHACCSILSTLPISIKKSCSVMRECKSRVTKHHLLPALDLFCFMVVGNTSMTYTHSTYLKKIEDIAREKIKNMRKFLILMVACDPSKRHTRHTQRTQFENHVPSCVSVNSGWSDTMSSKLLIFFPMTSA